MKLFIFRRMKCPKCDGTGKIRGRDIGAIDCKDCDGTGRILAPRESC